MIEDLYQTAPTNPLVEDLTSTNDPVPLQGGALDNRSFKFDTVLGEESPGMPKIKEQLMAGDEGLLRQQVVAKEDSKNSAAVRSLVESSAGAGLSAALPILAAVADTPPEDPTTALEKAFAAQVVDQNIAISNNESVHETLTSELMGPELQELNKNYVLRNIKESVTQDYEARWEARGWGAWALGEAVQNFVPFASWANITRDPGDETVPTGNWLSGQNMLERANALLALEPNEFAKELRTEMEALWAVNPSDAMSFLSMVNRRSAADAVFHTGGDLLNVPAGKLLKATKLGKYVVRSVEVDRSIAGGAEAVAKATKNAEAMSAVKDISEAATRKGATPTDVIATAGNIEEAASLEARLKVAKSLVPEGASPQVTAKFSELSDVIPSMFNPELKFADAPEYAKKMAQEIADRYAINIRNIAKALSHNATIRTLSPEAQDQAFKLAEKELLTSRKGLADFQKGAVVRYLPENNLGIGQVEATFGTKTGYFSSAEDALQAAKQKFKFADGSFLINQEGTGYSIKVYKDVAEVGDSSIDDLIVTGANRSDHGVGSLSKVLGPELGDIVGTALKSLGGSKTFTSGFQSQQRAALAMGQTGMEAAVRQLAEPIVRLYEGGGKKQWNDFQKMLDIGRTTLRDPADPTSMGVWYKTAGELAQNYMLHMKRLPTQAEEDAYFTYVLLSDLDYVNRSILSWKEGVKLGQKNWVTRAFAKDGSSKRFEFEGKRVEVVPSGNIDFIRINKDGSSVLDNFKKMGDREEFLKQVKNGVIKIIKLRKPDTSALNDLVAKKDGDIVYVATTETEEAPLSIARQVNYSPGGHVVYKNSHYVKASNIVDGQYKGDVTILAANSPKEANELAGKLQRATGFYEMKDKASFEKYLRENLPWTPKEFVQLYRQGLLKKGMRFAGVHQGQKTVDAGVRFADGRFFTDHFGDVDKHSIEAYSDVYQSIGDFAQAKSGRLQQVVNQGTESAPVWKLEDAALVNPLATQVQTMSRIIRNALYEDYQLSAARSWIEEFGNASSKKATGLSYNGRQLSMDELRKRPIFYLKNATIAVADPVRAAQAMQIRNSIMGLLGTPSKRALDIDYLKYSAFDGKLGNYIPDKAIPFLKDPFRYARAVAFHTKLGLFNPVQLFVQSTTLANAYAIAPKHAFKAMRVSPLLLRTNLTSDPKIIEHFGAMSEKLGGTTKREFVDMRKWMDHFGVDTIGKEYAWLDDASDAVVFRSTLGKVFLDKGPMLFNAAERMVRVNGFATAYLEYIAKNPGKAGKMTIEDAKQVLVRSQVFFANMTRDANAWWQRGLFGNFTQFFGFNARMVELMVGKQLTMGERTRLAATYGMLFGAPPLAGTYAALTSGDIGMAETSINPFDEDIRSYALKKGINLDEGVLKFLYHGISAAVVEAGTGHLYNVGERYGMSAPVIGETIKRNFEEHDAIPAAIITMLGASGSIGYDIASSFGPLFSDMAQAAGGTGATSVSAMDLVNSMREVSSANSAYRVGTALLGVPYLSKSGTILNTEQEPFNEVFKALSGLSEMEETDAFRMISSMKDRKAMINTVTKRVRQLQHYKLQVPASDHEAINRQIEAILNSFPLLPKEKYRIQFPRAGEDAELDKAVTDSFEKNFRSNNGVQ